MGESEEEEKAGGAAERTLGGLGGVSGISGMAPNVRRGRCPATGDAGYVQGVDMRNLRRLQSLRTAQGLLLGLALLTSVGCDEPPPGPIGVVRAVEISLPNSTLRPGRTMIATARPLDADGDLVELPVVWRSLSPALLEVLPAGELRALAPGVGIVEATAGGVTGRVEVPLVNPAAALIRTPNDTLRLTLPGAPAILQAAAFDAAGEEIVGAQIVWSTEAARIAQVNASGQVVPVAIGVTTLTASLDAQQSSRIARVSVVENTAAPAINEVSIPTLTPGVPFTLRGVRFGATPSANTVMVDGLVATVTAASATELTAVLSTSGVPCLATRNVAVQVTTASGIGATTTRLQVAPQRMLAVGEALLLTNASAATCNEIADGTGRYLIALQHGGRALGAGPISVTLEGRAGVAPIVALAASHTTISRRVSATLSAHERLLAASADAVRSAPTQTGVRRDAPSLQLPPVNGIVQLRVPNLESPNLCNEFSTIGARTVYEGARVAILEDTSALRAGVPTLAGAMDDYYVDLGQEFDAVLWPLAQRFGDPLVMDGRLDANDKVVLVATPKLNDVFDGEILGAVVTCDLYARAQFASSNVGEVMYLQVPTSTAAGMGAGTRDRWRYEIRATIAHELKHIVSFAGRVVRSQPLEEPWLEEATARHAEELFARARLGFSPTGNTGYGALDCEVRALAGAPDCSDAPRSMLPHFEGLWDFLASPSSLSPLGPTSPGDVSYYGSGWSLTRWALDHAGQAEEVVLQNLTASGQSGIANLEARTGRTWDDILGRWALALMAESRNIVASDSTLRIPSWNLANVFGGLCVSVGSCGGATGTARFTRAQALRFVLVNESSFSLSINELVPGGFSAIEVGPGDAGSRRLLRLRGAAGGSVPPTARLAILRIE